MLKVLIVTLLIAVLTWGLSAQEASGPVAAAVTKDVLQLEHEKVQCFASATAGTNNCAEWFQEHYADEDLDITTFGAGPRRRSKSVVIRELQSGKRKFVTFNQSNKTVNIYTPAPGGEAGDGTTAVITYTAVGTSETDGKRADFDDFCIDVWTKQGGRWLLVLMNSRTAY